MQSDRMEINDLAIFLRLFLLGDLFEVTRSGSNNRIVRTNNNLINFSIGEVESSAFRILVRLGVVIALMLFTVGGVCGGGVEC